RHEVGKLTLEEEVKSTEIADTELASQHQPPARAGEERPPESRLRQTPPAPRSSSRGATWRPARSAWRGQNVRQRRGQSRDDLAAPSHPPNRGSCGGKTRPGIAGPQDSARHRASAPRRFPTTRRGSVRSCAASRLPP